MYAQPVAHQDDARFSVDAFEVAAVTAGLRAVLLVDRLTFPRESPERLVDLHGDVLCVFRSGPPRRLPERITTAAVEGGMSTDGM